MHDVMDRPQFGGVISRMVALNRSFALFTHLKPKMSGMAQADIRTKRQSAIGLSRGVAGLYVIIPSAWAMACLSVPIGRFLTALFDARRIRAATW